MSSSQNNTSTPITTIEELRARRQAEKAEREQKQREEDEAFEEELRRLAEEEEKRKREEEERRRKLEEMEREWIRQEEVKRVKKEKRKAVEILFWELDIMVVVGDNEGQDRVSPTFYASRISARTNHGFEGSAVNRGYC